MTGSDERRARFMPTEAWEAHKATLAQKGALSRDEWVALSSTLHAVGSLRLLVLDDTPGTPLSPEGLKGMAEQRVHLGDVYKLITGEPIGLKPANPAGAASG